MYLCCRHIQRFQVYNAILQDYSANVAPETANDFTKQNQVANLWRTGRCLKNSQRKAMRQKASIIKPNSGVSKTLKRFRARSKIFSWLLFR